MKINLQEAFQSLGSTYPKARHLSQVLGWVEGLCLCSSQLGEGRLAFSLSLGELQLGRERQGMLWPEISKGVLRQPGHGRECWGMDNAGSHRVECGCPQETWRPRES